MALFLKDVLIIMRKELLHFFRDPHVLIYSILLPMLGYPLLLVSGFEGALWQESLATRKTVRLAIIQSPAQAAFFTALSRSPRFEVKKTSDPLGALKRGEIDAVMRLGKDGQTVEATINATSDRTALAQKRISDITLDEVDRQSAEALKAAGKDANFLKVFSIKMRNLAPIAEVSSYVLPTICGFALLMIGFGAIYPTVCAFPEEREKRTLDSTLILPVSRAALVLGKCFAIFTVGLMSGVINLISMLMVFWVMTLQPKVQLLVGNLGGGSLFGGFQWSQLILIFACFVVIAFEIAALFLVMAHAARTFKEGQNILTIPVISMALIPLILCYPGLTLNWRTVLIPVFNIVLCLRSAFSGASDMNLCCLALAQNLVLSILLLVLVSKIVGREEFLQGDVRLLSILTGGNWRNR